MLAVCHSELHLSYQDIMDYPSLEFAGMIRQFRQFREDQNKNYRENNAEDIPEEDLDTSMWFKK